MKTFVSLINNGPDLKQAIDDEDIELTYSTLLLCYAEIRTAINIPAYSGETIFEITEYLDSDLAELNELDINNLDEDELNCFLDTFYELCDGYNIWVG